MISIDAGSSGMEYDSPVLEFDSSVSLTNFESFSNFKEDNLSAGILLTMVTTEFGTRYEDKTGFRTRIPTFNSVAHIGSDFYQLIGQIRWLNFFFIVRILFFEIPYA